MNLTWTRSSYCANGACTAVAYDNGRILVRNSKAGDNSPILDYSAEEWGDFVAAFLTDPLHAPGLRCRLLTSGGGWVWTKDGVVLEFTDEEMQAFGDGAKAGEFTVGALAAVR